MNLTTSMEATGYTGPDKYSEPELVGTEVVEFNPDEYHTKRELQNRQGTKNRQIKMTEQGFYVYSDSQDALSEHFLLNAKNGVNSEDAVPALTVAVMDGRKYLVGGHHRAAGLVMAREKANNEKQQELFDAQGIDLTSKLGSIKVETWNCSNEYELKILSDRENSESQHGERNTPQERDKMIKEILLDPYKRQFSDMAIAIKFLGYPKARGKIQKDRAKMVKAGDIDKVEKTIDVNGTPRTASRPGAHAIELLNSNTEKLEIAMEAYVPGENATLITLGEAAGAWKDAWKNAVQHLNDEEKAEMTTWLEELYADVEGVESPLAPAKQTKDDAPETKPEAPANEAPKAESAPKTESTEETNEEESTDDTQPDEETLDEIKAAAAGTAPANNESTQEATQPKQEETDHHAEFINSLADAVSSVMEIDDDKSNHYVERLEAIISDFTNDYFNDEEEDENEEETE